MVRLIEALVRRGHAYVAEEHVLFDVSSMPDYGRLSNRSLEEMEAGARVDVAPYKKGPMDFVLWKPSKAGEPSWLSPCGITTPGRPGWHIECSAMAGALLGETFDIHGGGIDLVFPHHENEVAQSRCAHGTPLMANVWMHNGFLQVEGEKMSKSLGNFVTIQELLAERGFGSQPWHGRVVRLAMLGTHYRQPIDWTVERLVQARATLMDFGSFLHEAPVAEEPHPEVIAALSDDLNTPSAMSIIHGIAKSAHRNAEVAAQLKATPAVSRRLRQRGAGGLCGGLRGCRASTRRRVGWPDRRPQRRPQGQELQGGRSHPRRAGRHGHPAQGCEEPIHGRDRDDLGSEAMSASPCVILGLGPRIQALKIAPAFADGWMAGTSPAMTALPAVMTIIGEQHDQP